MPLKANHDRSHHIPKQRHRVTNWAAYDIALRRRGSLTVWFTEAAIAAWKAEPRYSAVAMRTALTLRAVFRLALRQTEGRIVSLLRLLGLDLAAPDHSTYNLGHTCNTWTVEALHVAGLPVTTSGVVFAGQVLDQLPPLLEPVTNAQSEH